MMIDKLLPGEVKVIEEIARNDHSISYVMAAKRLGMTPGGVKSTMGRVLQKTGTFSRLELVLNWRCPLFQIGLKELGIL